MSLIIGVAMPQLFGGSLAVNVLENPYTDTKLEVEDVFVKYHLNVNAITNQYLEILITEEDPVVLFPQNVEDCASENVSTFCLADVLNKELRDLETAFAERSDEFEIPSDGDLENRIDAALKQTADRQLLINDELEVAKMTLDLTLETYNQIQLVYPLHKEFLTLIENLEDYRDNLGALRAVIDGFPSKFNDATTIHCK
ncbi:hypothetical protein HOC00_00830 [Candidatus Peregrinibacteria bacterium]|jgi:hypothetical protein|nr:hypothetical protein [Candidatus Peregrinibacteria bacterium]